MPTFFGWLGRQTERQDTVGVLARLAVKDPIFPRHGSRLILFLIRYEHMPEQRQAVKIAHREWRQYRRKKVVA
jgi:hypothetical protein